MFSDFVLSSTAGPSGLQSSNSRKRVCPTCEANEAVPKRLRLHTTLANSEEMLGQLQISTTSIPPTPQIPCCTPPRTPPHTPGVSYGSLHSFNRHSPPLCSTTQRHTNVSIVHSHTAGGVMSTASSSSRGLRFSNTPATESQYGAIPCTSQQVCCPLVNCDLVLHLKSFTSFEHVNLLP